TIHNYGFVVGDIKPANLIVTTTGFRFIDLELAGPPTCDPVIGMGTRGYASPQQCDPRHGRSYADDIYAVGATLLGAALLVDCSALPDTLRVAQFELERDPQNAVLRAVVRCLAPTPEGRYTSVTEIREAVFNEPASSGVSIYEELVTGPPPYLELARSIGDDLITRAVRSAEH